VVLKRRLVDVLEALLGPIRERRAALSRDLTYVRDVVRQGTFQADLTTRSTLRDVRRAFALEG
jgi:tryptophanyl-tRNA synthetase